MPNVRLALVLMTFLGSAKPYTIFESKKSRSALHGQGVDDDLPIEIVHLVVGLDLGADEDVGTENDCDVGDVSSKEFWIWEGSLIDHVEFEIFGTVADVDFDAWLWFKTGK